MTAVASILQELRAIGAIAYRRGSEVRMRPAKAITPELLQRVKLHKAQLLAVLPDTPPAAGALAETPSAPDATTVEPLPADERGPWMVASGSSEGAMRLFVEVHPSTWPPELYRMAALVEVLDARHRADRADAQEIADELEDLLVALRAEGVEAWLTS